ncbi:MAG: MFS transporter [Gracilibacteraceae bacterium]|jgi:MFS family permease|nr:MFS transporter [Gracilibacteraceae bacterium]
MDAVNKKGISEIIDAVGGKFSKNLLLLLGIANVFYFYNNMIISYTMSQMRSEWGLDALQTGSLTTYSLLGAMIGAASAGIIADKIGRKKTLVTAVFICGITTLPIYFVHSYSIFAVLRVICGLGVGACLPQVLTTISEFTPTKSRAIFVTFAMCFTALGATTTGLVGAFIIPTYGWRIGYLIGGVPIIWAVILAFTMYESPYYLASVGRKKEALEVLYHLEKIGKGTRTELSEDVLVLPPKPKKVGVGALFSRNYLKTTVGLWMMYFCGAFIIYGIGAWLPSLMLEKGYAMSAAYALGLSNNVASVFSNAVTGKGSDVFGRRNNIMLGFAASAVMFVILANVQGSFILIFATIFLTSFSFNYATTAVQPLAPESYPTEFRGTGVSWFNGFSKFGALLAPLVAGVVIGAGASFSTAILIFTVPSVIGIGAAFITVRTDTRGKSMDQLAAEKELAEA